MIELFQGSIFHSKCDLMIIPCNTMGHVTQSVEQEISINDLPRFHRKLQPGEVAFVQTNGKFANASMVGYAASVDVSTNQSSEAILRNILRSMKQYCCEQSLEKINIPLLGTGAGGLSAQASYHTMEAEFGDDPRLSLCVYAISPHLYSQLLFEKSSAARKEIKNPRVFISYTGSDSENRKWVKELACKLRGCGVNARLDMFHLKPGQDLPQWMTNELIMADKVLLICDKYYAKKADNRKGGVGWETMIIQGDLLARQEQNKYIAILRDPNMDQSLPLYVKSRYALDWSHKDMDDKDFEELLLYLFDCDMEPPIGEIPDFIKERFAL